MERAQNLPIFFSGNDIERSVNLAAHQIDVGDTLKPLIFVVFPLCPSVSTAPQLKPVSTTDVSMKLEECKHTQT